MDNLKLFYVEDCGFYGYWIVGKSMTQFIDEVLPEYDLDKNNVDVAEVDGDFLLRVYFPDDIDGNLPSEIKYDAKKNNIPFVEASVDKWIGVSELGDMIACWGI